MLVTWLYTQWGIDKSSYGSLRLPDMPFIPSLGHVKIGSGPGKSDELNLPDLRGFAVEIIRLQTEDSI